MILTNNMEIAFTGSRHLDKQQEIQVYKEFQKFVSTSEQNWHVGDMTGLDAFVRRAHPYYSIRADEGYKVKKLTVYKVEGNERWHFAERSKRMIEAIANLENSCLYAFPVNPCHVGCKPSKSPNGKGSGTWLTIAYAKYLNVPIQLFPLADFELPNWLK